MWFKGGMTVLILLFWCREILKLMDGDQPGWSKAFRWVIVGETGAIGIMVWLSSYPTKADAWTAMTVFAMVVTAATQSTLQRRLRIRRTEKLTEEA